MTIIGVIKLKPSLRREFISNSSSKSPKLTWDSLLTWDLKYLPFKLIVSKPICIRSSTPVSVLNKIPCLLSSIDITLPSAGAYTFPSLGIIATPSPISLSAKVLSGTFDNFSNVPAIGE